MVNTYPNTNELPIASRDADGEHCLAQLANHPTLAALLEEPHHRALIRSSAGNAPFLARLMIKYPGQLADILSLGAAEAWNALMPQTLQPPTHDQTGIMQHLRHMKARAALTIALADISGEWALEQVTRAISLFAADAVTLALRFLLRQAAAKGELKIENDDAPETGTGIIILGMGKLGGFELNYSSDIDLIVLFEHELLPYTGARNANIFMNKLAGDLVSLLQERTSDGYVFRTDLRLRPDPMSTPLAVTTMAALTYYETVGQNWERAAMIKARPIAGDMEAANRYMHELVPFIWRKTLDFATIADIHSIKRQMNSKAAKEISIPGHNIKTGMGGIREIEFFVQTQQLVWGGRIQALRLKGTIETLNMLTEYELVRPDVRDTLTKSYRFLRHLEHRLQMRNDEQTHSLPTDDASLREVSLFCGYDAADDFAASCLDTLSKVSAIYTDSMGDSEPLAVDGNLVFTGVEADPDTLSTLANMGYTECNRISDIIQGWHRGHRKSTRSKRSRQVLTELIPALLTALSKTANPDAAFFHFDDFIDRLPSGAQIFSLFLSRPEMLTLLADILGSAPALGDTLSNNPSLLDSVLDADFFLGLPSKEELENMLADRLRYAEEFEQKMLFLRSFNNEKRFQAGVHLLKQLASPKRVGAFLSDIAEIILQSTMQEVWAEYRTGRALDPIPFVVLAMGKLGGREMTFGSDLDIVFIYDDGGEAGAEARTHINRISQRFISALTLLTREGRLYEIDTRLRPGGSDGPLAATLIAFDAYFENSAWTYEHMALTRARVAATNAPEFAAKVETTVRHHVLKPRDFNVLLKDVTDMRARIAQQFPTSNPWALKHVRGGMVDLDFIAQYLVLRYGREYPTIWKRNAHAVLQNVLTSGILPDTVIAPLLEAKKFQSDLMSLLRLSAPGGLITDDAPLGLKRLLTKAQRMKNFSALKEKLIALEATVSAAYSKMEGGLFSPLSD